MPITEYQRTKKYLIQRGRKGILSPEIKEFLDKVPDTFNWDKIDNEAVWMDNYNKVKCFYEEKGKFPSVSSKDWEEGKLGHWINNQKTSRKDKGGYKLTEERIFLLEKLPNWKWETNFDDVWNEKYNKVKCFIEKNKKYPSENSKDEEEKTLIRWVFNQRQAKKGKGTCKLTEERISLLVSLPNWKWDDVFNDRWGANYNKVKGFHKEKGKYPSQTSKNKEERKLGNWITKQKMAKKGKGIYKITEEKISLLEELPNWKW